MQNPDEAIEQYQLAKKDRERSEEAMSKKQTFEPYPCAWEVRVRRTDPLTPWHRYNIYERYELAVATVKRVEGAPLELKIVPLYAAEDKP